MKAKWVPLLLFLAFGALPAAAHPGPLLVILLPGTSLRDWQTADAPYLHQLMATGALAVMNTRTARLPNDRTRETAESALLTLGAGSRAAGNSDDTPFLSTTDPVPGIDLDAGALYERRMGLPPPHTALVNPDWPHALRDNHGRGYDIHLGNLAETLSAANVKIKALGGRYADLVAADQNGAVIPVPSVSARVADCVVWDAGSNLSAVDTLLPSALLSLKALHGRVIILSPFADDSDYSHGRRLAPVLEWGEGIPTGLIVSHSTRRAGIVTNTDFAPTVAAYFGLTTMPVRPFGQAWETVPTPRSEPIVSEMEEQAYRQERGMKLLPYLAVILAVWMLAGTILLFLRRMPQIWPLIPPVLLLALVFSDRAEVLPAFFGSCLLISWALQRRAGPRAALFFMLATLTFSLLADMVSGSNLMKRSLLGYSAVEGARYYGIGNEAMGVLLGSLLVLAARLWQWKPRMRVFLSLGLGMIALALGSSLAGAKAGGLLVSLIAFGTLLFELWGGKWSRKIGLALFGAVLSIMALAALADALLFVGGHSHIGEAVQRMMTGGIGEGWDIIERKLRVESRLAYHSAWALPLWIGIASLLTIRKQRSPLKAAGLTAVLACLAFNDAGVIAAALCLVSLWSDAILCFHTQKPPMV